MTRMYTSARNDYAALSVELVMEALGIEKWVHTKL